MNYSVLLYYTVLNYLHHAVTGTKVHDVNCSYLLLFIYYVKLVCLRWV